jgi:serine/threonine protein kinase
MEYIRKLVSQIDLKKTNLDGSKYSFDNLTLYDIYEIAAPKIEEICLLYNMTNFSLPKISGYNSIVIYTDSIMEDKMYKYAIKIYIFEKNDIEILNTIHKQISENDISPKIYYDYIVDYNSPNFIVKINVSERVILYSDFEWKTVKQIKNTIITLIEKTLKLHSLGFVHNDIKCDNIGVDTEGNTFLFDFDNFSKITKSSCIKIHSTSICHPPSQ